MDKNFKIWGVRSGMIGDMIMALPILNFLELKMPGSYKYWVIGNRFSQSAQLFFNHPLIDKIHILKSQERLEDSHDIEIAEKCDIKFNVTPSHSDGEPGIDCFWWNKYNLCEETFRMTGLDAELYRNMPNQLKKPRLNKWFNTVKIPNSIAIWPYAAYGKEPNRSPSPEIVKNIFRELLGKGYHVYHFGHPNDPKLHTEFSNYRDRYHNLSHMSLFEQVKLTLSCNTCINTDSGIGWVIGAYGHKQISIIVKNAPNHVENLLAFAPENCLNNNINLLANNSNDDTIIQGILSSEYLNVK